MRLGPATLIAMASATALACASIYDYRYRGSGESAPDVEALAGRLAAVLEPHGFVRLALAKAEPIPQGGDTGQACCPGASEPVVFLRDQSGRTSVHLYACRGDARIVTLADGSARGEPERTRDLLSRELAAELSSGAVVLERRRRIALE
jgi:hypothetical protein